MVRVSSPAKLRPWSELTAKTVMGVVPGLVTQKVQKDSPEPPTPLLPGGHGFGKNYTDKGSSSHGDVRLAQKE